LSTSTHTSCYATVRSLALPHIRHATLLCVLLPFRTYVMLRYCAFSCPFAHTSYYATVSSLEQAREVDATGGWVGNLYRYHFIIICTPSCFWLIGNSPCLDFFLVFVGTFLRLQATTSDALSLCGWITLGSNGWRLVWNNIICSHLKITLFGPS